MKMETQMNKRGLATQTVVGILALVFVIIIAFVMVAQLKSADLLGDDLTITIAVTNETGGFVNETGYTLAQVNASNSAYTITALWNATDDTPFGIGNATVSAAGVVTNATTVNWADVLISYTYTYTYPNTYNSSSDYLSGNFTGGVDNISSKVPTFFTIIAAILIIGFVVLLWTQFRRTGLNTGVGI